MALSRELTRRLHIEEEPIAKRLKLAENAFTREDLPITRKEDLILKWLCREAERERREKKVNDKFVWSALSRCLGCEKIILRSDVKRILIDTLVEKLASMEKSEDGDDGVLDCCKMIFANGEMRRYFQSEISLLCKLIATLFRLVYSANETTEKNRLSRTDDPRMRRVVDGVECLVTCYKRSTNKDGFTDIFVREILYPLCVIADGSGEKIGAETHKCVQRLMFGKLRYSRFKERREDDNNFAERVFAGLKKNAEIREENTTVVVFSYVFRAAIASYKNDPATIDSIFRSLVDSACRSRINVLASIRHQLTDLTFDYRNKIGDFTLFEYLGKFIDEILSSKRMDSVCYEALGTIAILNPLIVETKIQNILERILLEKKETKSEMDSYRDLMIVITSAGVRLRREQKLVPWILKALEKRLGESDDVDIDIDDVFPTDFKKQFAKSVGDMTCTQTIGVLRTLIFHLNNCVQTCVKDQHTANFMLRANVALMSAYFEGVRIFDNSVPISGRDKFVRALRELGKTISLLFERVSRIEENKEMLTAVLTVTWYRDTIHDWMRYYGAPPENLDFPISDELGSIVEKIDDARCKNAMNKILVRKIGRNLDDETIPPDFSCLSDGLRDSWSIILDRDPQILSSMNNSQMAELAGLLLNDAISGDSAKSIERLSADVVQNDESFVKALVYRTLVDITTGVNESTTKIITGRVDVAKNLNRGNLRKLMKEIKDDLMRNEWTCLNDESISMVEKYLKILLHLPLKHLSLDLRTLLLLIVYSIKKESEGNEAIVQLCTDMTLEASEKSDIDIIDFIDPDSLIDELTRDTSVRRVMESSLRNVSSWETLKVLVKKCQRNDESAAIFLELVERVRPKLKNQQREILRKAEEKLCKKLLDGINEESTDYRDAKRLTVALKVSMTNGEIPDNFVAIAKSILHRIFTSGASKDDDEEKLVAEGLRLVNVVLKHRGNSLFNDEIVNNVWPHVLNNPIKEIVQPLLERTEPKALSKLFTLLRTRTIRALTESNESHLTRAFIVWDSITSVQMGGPRHKLRTAALRNLLQTLQVSAIPVEFWPAVLKFVQSTLFDALHVVEKEIDVVTLLAGRSLKEAKLSACENVVAIFLSLVKFNAGVITDRLPVLLGLYRQLVRLVVDESRRDSSRQNRKLGCLALDIEKLTNALVKLKKDLARLSPYVIADLVEIFSEGAIPTRVKGPLEDSVGHFLSISDQHAISLLSRTLPNATRGIFKELYETYNKFYKFTGKI